VSTLFARGCSISQSTVHEYVSAAEAAGVKWPLPIWRWLNPSDCSRRTSFNLRMVSLFCGN
jgi:hypothetical protein